MRRLTLVPCLGVLVFAPACTVLLQPRCVQPPEAPAGVEPLAAWGRVLAMDFRAYDGYRWMNGLERNTADLDAFVAWVAQPGTEPVAGSGASTKERLAFGLNAYAAFFLFGWVDGRRGPRGESFFDYLLFCVGGRWVSLRQFEEDFIRPLGDTRALFALRCLSDGGPPPPRQPFAAAHLDEQLDQLMREFLDDRRNVEVDASGRRVLLSPWIRALPQSCRRPGWA